MANIKNVVIVREDLNLPFGLLAAQVAHIAMEPLRQSLLKEEKSYEDFNSWVKSPYLYIHKVPNKEWLDYYINKAQYAKLPVSCWHDTLYLKSSPTQQIAFENVLVGASLGPSDSDKIKSVIGDLPLL